MVLFGLSLTFNVFGQQNFQWERTDTISKTKSQLYADTKMFIAEEWKSAQNVIQNDDKETGSILIKGRQVNQLYIVLIQDNIGFHIL